jgi:MFS family permease
VFELMANQQGAGSSTRPGLGSRLLPLYVATFLQNLALWVPIEKLFMTSIGFTSASVGVMAAMYAIVVPFLEVPSGVLADRWSRRGVLILAVVAAIASVLVGGASNSVPVYLVSAALLGIFFALQSGTLESIVYDTVLEETGDSDAFEATIGRVRVVESVALVGGALAGGAIAQIAPLRAAYFLTAPLLALSAILLLRFREPRLHKTDEQTSLRDQIRTTYRTILTGGQLRAVVALTIVAAVLMQGALEFGPLWLVAFGVPAFLFGPQWAGLTAALGLGGLLGARTWFTNVWTIRVVATAVVGCGLVLAMSSDPLVVVGAQVLLVILVVAVSIPATRGLHDAVPSAIRAGVASGVGTLTWLTFVPFAIAIGAVSEIAGIERAGWLFVAVGAAAAVLTLVVLPGARPAPEAAPPAVQGAPAAAGLAGFAADQFRQADDPDWPGHWATPPEPWSASAVPLESAATTDLAKVSIGELPGELRRVVVLRDVEGRSPSHVQRALNLSPGQERALLHRARGLVRARLERSFDRTGVE